MKKRKPRIVDRRRIGCTREYHCEEIEFCVNIANVQYNSWINFVNCEMKHLPPRLCSREYNDYQNEKKRMMLANGHHQ
jgi:hypothetical protein